MAQFYANIRGNRGEATRMGTKDSEIYGHIRGWHIGASVRCYHENGEDRVQINLTDGSNGCRSISVLDIPQSEFEALESLEVERVNG